MNGRRPLRILQPLTKLEHIVLCRQILRHVPRHSICQQGFYSITSGSSVPSALTILRIQIEVAPFFAGSPLTAICSPGWRAFSVHPARTKWLGLVNSPCHFAIEPSLCLTSR